MRLSRIWPVGDFHRCIKAPHSGSHALHSELAFLNVHLVTTPKEYERVLYYPQAYEALAPLSPPATWVPVPQYQPGTVVPRSVLVGAAQEAASWPGCEYVMIKDYLKKS